MKKLYLLFFLSFIFPHQISQAQSKLIFKPHLEVGYEDNVILLHERYNYDNVISADLRYMGYGKLFLSAEYRNFSFYCSNKTYFIPEKVYIYDPKATEFILGGSYRLSYFYLYYEHMCTHTFRNNNLNLAYDRAGLRINFYKENGK